MMQPAQAPFVPTSRMAILLANPIPPPASSPIDLTAVLASPECMHAMHTLRSRTSAPPPRHLAAPPATDAAPLPAEALRQSAVAAAVAPLHHAVRAAQTMQQADFAVVTGVCLTAAGMAQLLLDAAAAVAAAVQETGLQTRGGQVRPPPAHA